MHGHHTGALPLVRACSFFLPRGFLPDAAIHSGGGYGALLYIACTEAVAALLCIQVRAAACCLITLCA